jgi:chemotaxis family two-component system response regulator Rcp1
MLHILLAEDNPGDVMLFQEALDGSGVPSDLTVTSDGEQALRQLRSSQFDLVILDLNLPKRDGQKILQLCARVDGAPPIIVFSSSSRQTDRELALLVGAKEYVVKPSSLDEFIQTVQDMLRRETTHAAVR